MIESGNTPSLKQRLLDWMVNGGTVASFQRQHPDRTARTYRQWASDPRFKELLRERSAEISDAVARRLRAVGELSAAELEALLKNPDPNIRLGAVRTAIRALVDVNRFADFESRLAKIERGRADES